MDYVSSSDDLPTRVMDLQGSRLVRSKSAVSSSELPVNVPHLQIEKTFIEDEDFLFAKSSISHGSSIAGILHICEDDNMKVAIGESGTFPTRQMIKAADVRDVERGKYFCIWNTTPVKINTQKRRTTVKYPLVCLFRETNLDEESYINIFSDEKYHKWFPVLLPHAIELMGEAVDGCFSNILDNTLAQFGSFNILYGQYFLAHVTSYSGRVCRFRVTITKEPLHTDPIRIIPIVEKGACTGEQCESYIGNSGLFAFDEWLLKWPV